MFSPPAPETRNNIELEARVQYYFTIAPLSLVCVPSESEASATNYFIVQAQSYNELQAYVNLALGLPYANVRFDAQYPRADLGAMNALDPFAYQKMRNIIVNARDSASNFQRNGMGKFPTVTNDLIDYCNEVNRYVGGQNLLRQQIRVLSDLDDDHWAPQTTEACKMGEIILKQIGRRAMQRRQFCDSLVMDAQLCLSQTVAIKSDIDALFESIGKLANKESIFTVILNVRDGTQRAIPALSAIREMFVRMSSDLKEISNLCNSMVPTIQAEDWLMRVLAAIDLDLVLSRWAEVKTLAPSFGTNAPTSWKSLQ